MFVTEPEPETGTAAIRDEKLRSGSTSGRAAGGQTTGPGKRAAVSHVQTGTGDRSSPRVSRGNCAAPVNDRDGDMKNLEDHLTVAEPFEKNSFIVFSTCIYFQRSCIRSCVEVALYPKYVASALKKLIFFDRK